MKKTVAAILSTATITGILASGVTAGATVIDGRQGVTSGNVPVTGIIGEFDNTTPGPNPEDINQWINVTIPTTAIFYTTEASNHTDIVSPTYTVTNNSAKGVIATVAGVDSVVNMDEVDVLNVNGIELFADGVATVGAEELFELGNNEGINNEGTFGFIGKATPTDTDEESNPSFNLVLSFAPVVEED